MKKLTALLVGILFVSVTSCDSIEDAISVSGTKTITNDFDVSIPANYSRNATKFK